MHPEDISVIWECPQCRSCLVREETVEGESTVSFVPGDRQSLLDGEYDDYFGATSFYICRECNSMIEEDD